MYLCILKGWWQRLPGFHAPRILQQSRFLKGQQRSHGLPPQYLLTEDTHGLREPCSLSTRLVAAWSNANRSRYFVNHTILCHIRVSCMLLVAIGVVISEVLSPDIANSYRPLAFYCAVADSTLTGFFESVFASLGTAIMSFYLIESYIKRAIALCCQPGDDGKSSWASNLRLLVGLTDGRQGITEPRPLDEGSRLPLFRLIATAISEMKHCFLNAISGMMFMGSFAVVQLITAWRAVHFDSNEESWTFGQLVPLLLLIIPMLSAGELISGRWSTCKTVDYPGSPDDIELRKKAAQDSDVHRCHELRSVDSVADSRHSSRTLLPGIEAAHEAISRPRITTYNPSSASTTWRSDGLLPTAKCSTSRGTETNLALYEQIRFRVVLYMLMISWPTASILAGAILAGWRAPGNDVLVIILGIYIVILRPLTNVIRFCTLRRGRSRRKRMDGLLRMVPGILAWRKRARETTREHREHDG